MRLAFAEVEYFNARTYALCDKPSDLDPKEFRRLMGWEEPRHCIRCGELVEPPRRVYAYPTCYTCLPPPTLEEDTY